MRRGEEDHIHTLVFEELPVEGPHLVTCDVPSKGKVGMQGFKHYAGCSLLVGNTAEEERSCAGKPWVMQ